MKIEIYTDPASVRAETSVENGSVSTRYRVVRAVGEFISCRELVRLLMAQLLDRRVIDAIPERIYRLPVGPILDGPDVVYITSIEDCPALLLGGAREGGKGGKE